MKLQELHETRQKQEPHKRIRDWVADAVETAEKARKLHSYHELVKFMPEATDSERSKDPSRFVFGPVPKLGRPYYFRVGKDGVFQKLNIAHASRTWATPKVQNNSQSENPVERYDAAFKDILRAAKFELKLYNEVGL